MMQVYLRSTSLLLVPPCFHAITAPEIHKQNVQKKSREASQIKEQGIPGSPEADLQVCHFGGCLGFGHPKFANGFHIKK